jgi:hypothetical protein
VDSNTCLKVDLTHFGVINLLNITGMPISLELGTEVIRKVIRIGILGADIEAYSLCPSIFVDLI